MNPDRYLYHGSRVGPNGLIKFQFSVKHPEFDWNKRAKIIGRGRKTSDVLLTLAEEVEKIENEGK